MNPSPSHNSPSGPQGFPLLDRCREKCAARPARLVFPDGEDARAVSAALRLRREGLGEAVLLGRPREIGRILREVNAREGLKPDSELQVLDPAGRSFLERNIEDYLALPRRADKPVSAEEARKYMSSPLAAGAMLVRRGEAEVGVGGNLSSTSDMLRAGLRIIGTRAGSRTVSGFFFMLAPANGFDSRPILVFADSGVIPEPSGDQLADIAIDSAGQFRRMTGQEAKVALLSFSSHGSAKHPRAEFVRAVTQEVRRREPGLVVDGELQFDAAMLPEVARRKVPQSPLAGEANVLIFPSLEAGNIGYKIAQRLGGYTAIGPLLQGLAGGWHDLSRGCSPDDIYQVSLIGTALERG